LLTCESIRRRNEIVAFGAKIWLPQIAVISGVNWAQDLTSVIIPTTATGKIALVALQLREYRAARPVNQVAAFGGSRRLCSAYSILFADPIIFPLFPPL